MYSITKMPHQSIKLCGWARQYLVETFEITRTNVIQDRVTADQRYNGACYNQKTDIFMPATFSGDVATFPVGSTAATFSDDVATFPIG